MVLVQTFISMKKLFLISASVLLVNSMAFSQTEKGVLLVGGTAAMSNEFSEGDDRFSFNLIPNLGLFVDNDVAVGLSVGLSYQKRGDFNSRAVNFSPFGRFYIGMSEKAKFLLEAGFGLFYSKSTSILNGDPISNDGFLVRGGPGIAFFLNESIAIEGILAYQKFGGDFDSSDIGLSIGVQAYLSRGE